MSIITERRESVMRDNNTAQDTLDFLLDKMNPSVKELVIGESLHGDLDFSILSTKGFRFISRIEFTKPGEITTLSNIPKEVRVLSCPDQLLVELANLPPELETLNVEGNDIHTLDLGVFSKLKVLNINDNRIDTLGELPATLEELYANRNGIQILDLKHATKLTILHVVGNDMTRLLHVPPSMVDLVLEDNPLVSIQYVELPDINASEPANAAETNAKDLDYLESLRTYFRMKRQYEEAVREKRREAFDRGHTRTQGTKRAKAFRPKCIHCARPVGTIFEQRDRRYIARCGNTGSPCELKIQLYRGNHTHHESILSMFRERIDEYKDSIIVQKLDTLFGYLSEDKSAEQFKKQLKEYSGDNQTYRELQQEYDDLHMNPHKREMIRAKIRQIYELKTTMKTMLAEYEKEGNEETLAVISDIYVREYLPEIRNLRLLNYEVMEMNTKVRPPDPHIDPRFQSVSPAEYWLFQKDVALTKDVIVSGEPPRVIAFTP